MWAIFHLYEEINILIIIIIIIIMLSTLFTGGLRRVNTGVTHNTCQGAIARVVDLSSLIESTSGTLVNKEANRLRELRATRTTTPLGTLCFVTAGEADHGSPLV